MRDKLHLIRQKYRWLYEIHHFSILPTCIIPQFTGYNPQNSITRWCVRKSNPDIWLCHLGVMRCACMSNSWTMRVHWRMPPLYLDAVGTIKHHFTRSYPHVEEKSNCIRFLPDELPSKTIHAVAHHCDYCIVTLFPWTPHTILASHQHASSWHQFCE
jgi:hypothetical protein